VFSAYGLLAADVRVTAVRSLLTPADGAAWAHVATAFEALIAEADEGLAEQDVAPAKRSFVRELDLRYRGQSTELTVVEPHGLEEAVEAFHERHLRRYGFAARLDPVEVVTVRVVGVGATEKPRFSSVEAGAPRLPADDASRERREVFDGQSFVEMPVYSRESLRPGDAFDGPAVVEQYDATTYVAPGWRAAVDGFGNVRMERR
jgi:N-methylhydantoinase A